MGEAYNFPDYGEQENPEHWADVYPQGFVAIRPEDPTDKREFRFEEEQYKGRVSRGYYLSVFWSAYGKSRQLLRGICHEVGSPEQAKRLVAREVKKHQDQGWQIKML